MCDEVEASTLYSRRPRVARKAHRCGACYEPIAAGAKYVAHSGLDDGAFWTLKQCARCDAMTTAIMARTTALIDLELNCGELWVDVFGALPPAVEALAFALPGDRPGSFPVSAG